MRVYVVGIKNFKVADHFVVGVVGAAGVRIASLDNNFRLLLDRIERNVQGVFLNVSKLKETPLAKLSKRAKTYLANIWVLLVCQPNGESGALLVNGANIFCIYGYTVCVRWSGGWCFYAYSPNENHPGWSPDDRVFSC